MNILNFLRKIKKRSLLLIVKNRVRKCLTLVGTGHQFSSKTRVSLLCGATSKNIILHNHAEIFGMLSVYGNGKIIFGEWSKIGENSKICCVNRVEIGKDTAIAEGVTIIDNNTHPTHPDDRRYMRRTPHGSYERKNIHSANAPIIIGENVWIGSNVRICKGVTIGDNAIIAACSVVTKSVPANAIAAGNPARIVKENYDVEVERVFPLKTAK